MSTLSFQAAVAEGLRRMRSGAGGVFMTLDAIGMNRAHRRAPYADLLRRADRVFPDGAGALLAIRLATGRALARVTGIDLSRELLAGAARFDLPVFLLGAQPGVAETAAIELVRESPGLRVVGTHHGYFTPDDEPALLARVSAGAPRLLLVALGAPRQEELMDRWRAALPSALMLGVGGTLDVFARRLRRAPRAFRRLGLEWLFRTLQEPRRLPRLLDIPPVLVRAALAAWKGRTP